MLHYTAMEERKLISKDNCSEIGFIKKAHGIQGEMLLSFNNGMEEAIQEPEFIFIEAEGLLVPFFVEGLTWRGDGFASIRLRYVASKEEAQQYTGCRVFADKDDLQFYEDGFNINRLIGFTIIDNKIGCIGTIGAINDFGGNIILTVIYKNEEILLPFNEELLVSLDYDASTVVMACPDGLPGLRD